MRSTTVSQFNGMEGPVEDEGLLPDGPVGLESLPSVGDARTVSGGASLIVAVGEPGFIIPDTGFRGAAGGAVGGEGAEAFGGSGRVFGLVTCGAAVGGRMEAGSTLGAAWAGGAWVGLTVFMTP